MSLSRCLLGIGLAVLFGIPSANASLIITEFMANPSSLPDDQGEYIEVFNSGPTAIAVDGLTLTDDGSDFHTFSGTGLTIGVGEFFVFGDSENSETPSYIDATWAEGSYFVANGADEIVILDSSNNELARLNYSDGDPFGAGVAAILDDITSDSSDESNFIAATGSIGSFTGGTNSDLGSPGFAGGTMMDSGNSVPEPASIVLFGMTLASVGFYRRRQKVQQSA